jgi:uncharacterized protein (TIGR03067 family)
MNRLCCVSIPLLLYSLCVLILLLVYPPGTRQRLSLKVNEKVNQLVETPTPEQIAAFKELRGTWRVDFSPGHDGSFTFNGEGRTITHTFEADKVIEEFTIRWETPYRLNPTKNPKQIDFYSLRDPAWIEKGIYQVEGERLVICRACRNRARPSDFSEEAEDGRTFVYLVRYIRGK